ncbi:WXG100 family type VII secretion target [Mycobacterium nebraskense]|uniref:ESAT-6-like protein n=1 Tax=Mycobacterium nebraskense TaxID=244292 RepID=A0A1X1YWA3_9MYCO|nr:WXG100 family type VII secretion target [Mycobacterium nebraskense]KKC01771.1 secretion protein [Mycobacterium nebraskense]MBI2694082.1 WXG100 family type VII secretion target [Mycobacterium nebraskense]MCV7119178.1 WXG100 family type VII secretion target [Mycobacterium nebraskense]ORW15358.1 secretion protein [Mycobacterium nebraskense]
MADDTVRVDPVVMQGFAVSLSGAAEHLSGQLAQLGDQVGQMLGGWQGASGTAYASAWELWHRGAREVQLGLSMLAHLVGQAGEGYQANEAGSAQAERAVRGG